MRWYIGERLIKGKDMNKKNAFSIILALVFVLNCFVFFTVGATEDESEPIGTSSSQSSSVVVTESTTPAPTTPAPTTPSTVPSTTTAPQTSSTSTATVADPVYTTTTTYQYDEQGHAITDEYNAPTVKTTEKGEEITEPTTVAKIVKDYGRQYGWLKWLSLVGMLLSLGGLIALNVMYKSVTPKSKRK